MYPVQLTFTLVAPGAKKGRQLNGKHDYETESPPTHWNPMAVNGRHTSSTSSRKEARCAGSSRSGVRTTSGNAGSTTSECERAICSETVADKAVGGNPPGAAKSLPMAGASSPKSMVGASPKSMVGASPKSMVGASPKSMVGASPKSMVGASPKSMAGPLSVALLVPASGGGASPYHIAVMQ